MLARGEPGPYKDEQNRTDISRWQPDFVLVSWKYKKTAILELTRPSDMLIAQMKETYGKKRNRNMCISYKLCSSTFTQAGA